jgi:hypothetical protein
VRILTWHVHGNYLYYLSQAPHEFFLPVKGDRSHPYGGRGETFPFGDNVHDIPFEAVPDNDFDLVLYQSHANYLEDRIALLNPEQRALPAVFLEHDPPRESPTDTRHPAADSPDVTLVHVTHFNRLMWDSGLARVHVVEHGVFAPPDVRYTGEIPRGLVVINNLATRGRRLGLDVFEEMRRVVPLDLVGMGSEALGGLGEIPPSRFPAFAARYRFLFNPIRYTSLGLAVCEAMILGMPVVGLATTEMVTAVSNGVQGYVATDPESLVPHMQRLIADPAEARRLGDNSRAVAEQRFGIQRFVADWDDVFRIAVRGRRPAAGAGVAP